MIVREKRYPKGIQNEVETRLAWLVDFHLIFEGFRIDVGNQNRATISEKRSWKAIQTKAALENEKMSRTLWEELREELGRTLGEG